MPKYSPLEIHIFLGCQIFWMRLSKLKSRNLLPSRGVCMTNVGCMLALIMYLAWLFWRRVRIQRLRTVHSTNIIIWLRVLGENFEGKPFSYHWLQQQQQPPVPPHLFNLLLQSIFSLYFRSSFPQCFGINSSKF